MIVDIILYVFGSLVGWTAALLPDWSLYPTGLIDGIEFFGEKIAGLNFFIFDIPEIMKIGIFILTFEIYYFTANKIASIINFFRGSGKLEL